MIHEFVEYIPKELIDGIIYVSIPFGTAVHKCPCGCQNRVVTPLSPTDWKITYDGESVSLHPSIGSWNLECKSHYWIKNNEIIWAAEWSKEEIETGRRQDILEKEEYYRTKKPPTVEGKSNDKIAVKNTWWARLKKWLFLGSER
jgi:hypothetical protein